MVGARSTERSHAEVGAGSEGILATPSHPPRTNKNNPRSRLFISRPFPGRLHPGRPNAPPRYYGAIAAVYSQFCIARHCTAFRQLNLRVAHVFAMRAEIARRLRQRLIGSKSSLDSR